LATAPSLSAGRAEGRVPPHDLEAEGSVLGSILLDPAAIARVLDLLSPDDFYRENNAQIYRAITELFRQGEPIDNITLADELTRMGVLERVGGRAHLAMLQEGVPTAANVEYYGRIVKAKAQKRRLITAGATVTGLGFDEAVEADDALNEAQRAVYDIADQRVGTKLESLYPLLKDAMERVDAQMARGTGILGVPTGFHELDRITSGFKNSDLVIIAARPSMGKTSLSTCIALHAAVTAQIPTAIFSLEMSKEQLVERLLCQQAKIDSQRMHRGMLSDREYEQLVMAIGPLENAPIFIDESPVLDELTLLLKARQARLQHNIGLIVVDYLQLMKGRASKDDNRVQEVSSISRSLKGLARELKIPVIALSQLSRGPEARPNKRPMLSDLRDSGSIEQDSDVVIFLYRDDYYNDKSEEPGICEVIIAKHRNGPTGMVKLRFRKDQTLFYNLESRRGASDEA
jgi:replicative DNA helicase